VWAQTEDAMGFIIDSLWPVKRYINSRLKPCKGQKPTWWQFVYSDMTNDYMNNIYISGGESWNWWWNGYGEKHENWSKIEARNTAYEWTPSVDMTQSQIKPYW